MPITWRHGKKQIRYTPTSRQEQDKDDDDEATKQIASMDSWSQCDWLEMPFEYAPIGGRQCILIKGVAYVPHTILITSAVQRYRTLLREWVRTHQQHVDLQTVEQLRIHLACWHKGLRQLIEPGLGDAKVQVFGIDKLPAPPCIRQLLQQYPLHQHRLVTFFSGVN